MYRRKYSNLKTYIESFDFDNAILSDVGWGGTIEKHIISIINKPICSLLMVNSMFIIK